MNGANYILNKYPNAKKVAFFHSHVLWPSHYPAELELITHLQYKEIQITSLICDDSLERCDANPNGGLDKCSRCIRTREKGFSLLPHGVDRLLIQPKELNFPISSDLSISDLKKIKYKNFDVGYATLSTVVSRFRDPNITIQKYYSEIQDTANKSIALYEFFIKCLNQIKPDLVILFNGRYAYCRALVRACEELSIPFFTHERGSSYQKYMLFHNALPHDLDLFKENVDLYWNDETMPIEEKLRIANLFFIDRSKGAEQGWYSFVKNQIVGLLPDNWSDDKHNIGIFLSSEDEFIAIGDQWERGLFSNQLEGLACIFNHFRLNNDIHFHVRIHPNSINAKDFIESVKGFSDHNIEIILPESEISTYSLLNKVDKAITFGSTVGIEATYWDKPSINLGNSFYKSLNVTYNPKTKEELFDLIEEINLSVCDKGKVYQYGYYLSTFGFDFKIYRPIGLKEGTFKGVNLQKVKGIMNKSIKDIGLLGKFINKVIKKYNYYYHYRLRTKYFHKYD